MKVVCKANNLNYFSDERLLKRLKACINSGGQIDLEIGREHTVYGVVYWDDNPWHYICSEEYDEYPVPKAAEFFNVLDNKLSSHWRLSVIEKEGIESTIVFEGQAKDPLSFYADLLDGDPEAIALFRKYRELMDCE